MNMIDWLKSTSAWMYEDRPDLFTSPSDALDTLEGWVQTIRHHRDVDNVTSGTIEMGGYVLNVYDEEGLEEWTLSKKISTVLIDLDGGECEAYTWVVNSGTMTKGPEGLKSVADFDDDDLDDDE